jgi:hypothetical protein
MKNQKNEVSELINESIELIHKGSEWTPLINLNDFSFINLNNKGEKFQGVFLGEYPEFCKLANIEQKPSIKGYVFLTEYGIQIMSIYHSLKQQLNENAIGKYIAVLRGESVIEEGEVKFIYFHLSVKK